MAETDLEARLDAVERALTDGESDITDIEKSADVVSELDRLEDRIESLASRVDDLDAAVQAVRGYVGNVRAVNRDVERRASAALATAETLETALESDGGGGTRSRDGSGPGSHTGSVSTQHAGHRSQSPGEGDSDSEEARGTTDGGAHTEQAGARDPSWSGDPAGPPNGANDAHTRARGQGTGSAADRHTGGGRQSGTGPDVRDRRDGHGTESDPTSGRANGDRDRRTRPEHTAEWASDRSDETDTARTSEFIERVRDVL